MRQENGEYDEKISYQSPEFRLDVEKMKTGRDLQSWKKDQGIKHLSISVQSRASVAGVMGKRARRRLMKKWEIFIEGFSGRAIPGNEDLPELSGMERNEIASY